MLLSVARNRISVKRQKTIFKEATPSATPETIAVTAQPIIPCTVFVELGSAAATGTVQVVGTDEAGGSQTETLAFSSGKLQQGLKVFKTITELIATNLSSVLISAKYRGRDGSQVKTQAEIYSCVSCQISYTAQSWPNARDGTTQKGNIKIMIPIFCNSSESRLREGDLVTDLDSSAEFMVKGIAFESGVGINSFQTVYAERREGTS